ncbi:MAG: hypothetical protein U9N59_10455 [Campylobacterota bacterium]|nr:hypothetical protein [Campylobacterota bacterium]
MPTNINKLSTILDELETETTQIKEFAGVLSKIDSLTNDVINLNKKIIENENSYKSIIVELASTTHNLDNLQKDLQKDLQNQFLKQSSENKKYYDELSKLINLKIDNMQLEIIDKNTNQINQFENKIASLQTSVEEIIESLKPKKKKWFIF